MKEFIYTKAFENEGSLQNVFIPTNKEWQTTEKQNLTIVESGKEGVLFENIIYHIYKAQDMICLQSFLIQDTKIIDALLTAKKERNVKIFVMDSAEARLNNSGFEEDESFATKDYKKMLAEKFKNNFVHRQANNLHAKFILIDPKTNPQGYLFTGNFNKKPFFENPELAVKLSKEQIEELYKVFVYHFWEYTTDEQTGNDQFDKVKSVDKFKRPYLINVLLTSPDKKLSNLKSTLLTSVKKAKEEIQLSTFGFDIKNELSQEILLKLQAGVKVIIFCRSREKAIKGNIEILAKVGAEVFCHPLIHAKSLVIDNNEGFIFSANFEAHGLDTGFEVGLKLSHLQLETLKIIMKTWENTFPFQFFAEKEISKLTEYFTFNTKGWIEEQKIKKEKIKSNSRLIKKVEDLITFIEESKVPKNFSSQKIIIEKIAKFNVFTENYISIENKSTAIDIIKYEKIVKQKRKKTKQKVKQEQAVLLTISKIKDIADLIDILDDDYVGINIFASNEQE